MFGYDLSGYDFFILFRAIGLTGCGLYICGFFCLSTGRIDSRGRGYFAIMFTAATCVMISLLAEFNLATAVIQSFYIVIAGYGFLKRRARPVANVSMAPSIVHSANTTHPTRAMPLTSKAR